MAFSERGCVDKGLRRKSETGRKWVAPKGLKELKVGPFQRSKLVNAIKP